MSEPAPGSGDKPAWFVEHEKADDERHTALKKATSTQTTFLSAFVAFVGAVGTAFQVYVNHK